MFVLVGATLETISKVVARVHILKYNTVRGQYDDSIIETGNITVSYHNIVAL